MTSTTDLAKVYLPPRVEGFAIVGPAEVHLDRVIHMVGCDFQHCTLMYHGERVATLSEWLTKAGMMHRAVRGQK